MYMIDSFLLVTNIIRQMQQYSEMSEVEMDRK